jgi:flagellar biosynthesis/type III secretory pathway chaperone
MEEKTADYEVMLAEQLERLENVLDCEHRALLAADTKTVTALAEEKLRISNALENVQPKITDPSHLSAEVRRLAGRVKELADLNNMLLKQLYQHYHGMVELFLRIGGRSRTYGKNGIVSIESSPEKGGEILA